MRLSTTVHSNLNIANGIKDLRFTLMGIKFLPVLPLVIGVWLVYYSLNQVEFRIIFQSRCVGPNCTITIFVQLHSLSVFPFWNMMPLLFPSLFLLISVLFVLSPQEYEWFDSDFIFCINQIHVLSMFLPSAKPSPRLPPITISHLSFLSLHLSSTIPAMISIRWFY